MISEESFQSNAVEFLRERLGTRVDQIDGDTELIQSGLLDSLMVLEFFFFLEGVRGGAIELDEEHPAGAMTLRSAYRLVTAA
jgi:acyl carrier protein